MNSLFESFEFYILCLSVLAGGFHILEKVHTKNLIKKDNQTREYYQSINDFLCQHSSSDKVFTYTPRKINYNFKKRIMELTEKKEYSAEVKETIKALINTTDNNSLLKMFLNMENLIIVKNKGKKKIFLSNYDKNTDGFYLPLENKILYHNQETLAHELLHMASSVCLNDQIYSGFKRTNKNVIFFQGLNEGFTQMLTRRKFFDEDYSTAYYTTSVYMTLLLELLFPKKEILERAYFDNNTEFVFSTFCQYGSKEEFYKINTFLDFFSCTIIQNTEDIDALKLLRSIILRTGDTKKISNSIDIIDKYLEQERPKIKKRTVI